MRNRNNRAGLVLVMFAWVSCSPSSEKASGLLRPDAGTTDGGTVEVYTTPPDATDDVGVDAAPGPSTDSVEPADVDNPADLDSPAGDADSDDDLQAEDAAPEETASLPDVDAGPADDPCAALDDGAACEKGSLRVCEGGATTALEVCPNGCIATPGGLPDVCANDLTEPFCAGHPDGPYCDGATLVTCTGGAKTATTPCPESCLSFTPGGPGKCLEPQIDGPCSAQPDGAHCEGNALITCAGGQLVTDEDCVLGCQPGPAASDDACGAPGPDGFCAGRADGNYCEGDTLVACSNQTGIGETLCISGCLADSEPNGCAPSVVATFCTGKSDGDWCEGDVLTTCSDDAVSATAACAHGCLPKPPGVPDVCAPAPIDTGFCVGKINGAWCSSESLVQCQNDAVSSQYLCPAGCHSKPPGVPDECATVASCNALPAKASQSPPTKSCAYMDWSMEPDGFYLISRFGTTNDATTLGNKTSCGHLQAQYNGKGCRWDNATGACLGGSHQIPWTHGHVDYDYGTVVSTVAANMGGDVPAPEYFYVADSQRFGCGSLLRVTNPANGRCVVAYTEDGGPGATYEGPGYGGRRILDTSPAVVQYLAVAHTGWKSSDLVMVEWGLAGDVPGHACTPCQSELAKVGTEAKKSAWDLLHMVPSCAPGAGGVSCSSGNGLYCGATAGLDPNTLYDCQGGVFSPKESCANGCQANPPGTPDSCSAGGTQDECAFGDGAYCGGPVGLDANTLYYCSAGSFSATQQCENGCSVNPPGTPDACAAGGTQASCPSGDGAYCGGPVGLDANTLYQCSGGTFAPSQQCAAGCSVNPPGVSDACNGTGGAPGQLIMCEPFKPTKPITCGFGCYDGHKGSDYACPDGTPVYAPISGTAVKVVNTVPGQTCALDFGNYVKIQQGSYDVILAHMSKNIQVSQGSPVSAGQLVGYASNSGYTLAYKSGQWVCQQGGGHHLHLETRKGGAPFNPVGSANVYWSPQCSSGGTSGGCPSGNGLYCGGSLGKDAGSLYNCQGGTATLVQACPSGCQVMPPGTSDQCAAGGTCPAGNGLYCGGPVGKDANTLYNCVNGAYSVAQSCSAGCQLMPAGTNDQCAAGAGSCPSGNGLYCGAPIGKDGNTLYTCTNGSYSVSQVCSNGCQTMPAGTSDQCAAAAATCPSGNGLYCGGPIGKDGNTLYTCTNGSYSVSEVCTSGCQTMPAGTSDQCAAAAATCPSGNGLYCGGPIGKDGNTLYTCSNGSYSVSQVCSNGCQTMPAGTNDQCAAAAATCPSGNGLYCGGSLGKDGNTLYNCSGSTSTFAAYCAAGCETKPPGQDDACKGGSCPSGNGAYCGGPVGLDGNTLYQCTGGKYTVKQGCSNGCYVAPPGQADACK